MAVYASYVDADTGSDSNGGTSWEDAWQTLQHGLSNCNIGSIRGDLLRLYLNGEFTLAGPLTFPTTFDGSLLALIGKTYGVDANGYRTSSAVIDLNLYSYAASNANFIAHIGVHIKGIKGEGHGGGVINVGSSGFWRYCKFENDPTSSGGYTFKSTQVGVRAADCDFLSSGTHDFTVMPVNLYRCLLDGFRPGYCSRGGVFHRCRLRNSLIGTGSVINWNSVFIDHCSFYDSYVNVADNCIPHITNNVFHLSSGSADAINVNSRGAQVIEGNCYKGYSEDAQTIARTVDYTAPTILVDDPFADASNNLWTPSVELAEIVGFDGLTPGAVQAASTGSAGFTGIRSYNRRRKVGT